MSAYISSRRCAATGKAAFVCIHVALYASTSFKRWLVLLPSLQPPGQFPITSRPGCDGESAIGNMPEVGGSRKESKKTERKK